VCLGQHRSLVVGFQGGHIVTADVSRCLLHRWGSHSTWEREDDGVSLRESPFGPDSAVVLSEEKMAVVSSRDNERIGPISVDRRIFAEQHTVDNDVAEPREGTSGLTAGSRSDQCAAGPDLVKTMARAQKLFT
jgi:hypothetical protein